MSIFSTESAHCHSKNHATENCPHGFLASKCGHCGSADHSTDNCPHGFLSTKCGHCGSTDHPTDSCPHGFLATKCGHCGSRNHSTDDCPHGFLSAKCSHCGSREHATDDCPHSGGSGGGGSDDGSIEAPADVIEAHSPVDSSTDWTPPLTPAERREMEIATRKQYAKILVVSCIMTTWVLFFGGYKILVLVPIVGLFKVFLDCPDFLPEGSGSGDSPLLLQLIWFLGFLANFVPLLVFIYLILRH